MSTAFKEPRTKTSTRKKTTINLEIDAADFGIIHLEASELIRVSRRGGAKSRKSALSNQGH